MSNTSFCNLLLVFLIVVSVGMVHAQDEYYAPSLPRPKPDSSLIYGRTKSHYYVRVEASSFRVRSHLAGGEFFSPAPYGLNAKAGLIAGFNYRDKWEVEMGLKGLGVYNSYRFDLHNSFGAPAGSGFGEGLRISYMHIPVTGKVMVWRPSKKISVLGTLGVGYSWYRKDGISFAGPMRGQGGLGLPDGSMLTYTITATHTKKSSFVTGEVGMELNWFFLRKLGLTVAAKRLFGPATVLLREGQVVEDTWGPPIDFLPRQVLLVPV
ncbi:hypothetical protein [Telluribacter humicola]|uniref:hypothetical protein n=1 Tax=Telluribacter humicola TaxID=1720261 RepID=UPI001A95C9C3|nr:hypothetical protein [Telluribacter humicola]